MMRFRTRVLLPMLTLLGALLFLRGPEAGAEAARPAAEPRTPRHHCHDHASESPATMPPQVAEPVLLYDAALGTTPDAQGFFYLTSPFSGAQATQQYSDGATVLDTTPVRAELAGYFGRSEVVPTLERAAGFRLSFEVQLISEAHDGSDRDGDGREDRAGFSVLVLSDDGLGIELAFWEGEIWAQEGGDSEPPAGTLFTHAEGAAFDTTAAPTRYALEVLGSRYALLVDGLTLLEGPLRDYSAFSGPVDPYETPNLVFLGDDTSSAQALVRLGDVSVESPIGSARLFLPVAVVP